MDTEQFLKFILHRKEIQAWMNAGAKRDQKIDIASSTSFLSGDGAKHFQTSDAMHATEVGYKQPEFVDSGNGCNGHIPPDVIYDNLVATQRLGARGG